VRINEVLDTSRLIRVNKNLNPKIWVDGELKPDVRAKLEEIALAFEEFIGIELDVVDYTITGSNANYTWNEYSDLDLHLIIPGIPTEEQKELFNAKKALWGEQHDIRIKGLPVECYVQGQDEPHHSTGVYSIADNQWLVEPKKTKPEVDDAAVTAKKDSLVHDVQTAMLSMDLDNIRKIKDKITKMRRAGLERAGEWSTENLVFKLLRNQGIIDRITEKIRELEDQELSLEQQDNILD
jgi:hypothetical protein